MKPGRVGADAPSARRRPRPTRPAGGNQARAERTREAILDETVRCVVEEGFAAASAKHIAERAGVTWGVIQYHFGDRDGLLMAVVDKGYEQLQATIAALEVPTGTPRQRVTAVVDAAWSAFADPVSMASLEILVATRPSRDPRAVEHLADLGRQLSALGTSIAPSAAGTDAGGVGDLLWAALRGMVLTQLVVSSPVDSSAERPALIDLLSNALERDSS